jgi:thiol-disulfide isomerase/thioredoxin
MKSPVIMSSRSRLIAAALALAVFAASAAPAPAQGARLTGLGGERLTEADLAQGTFIFVFWASWSPRSRDVVARVNPIAQRWQGRARVATVNYQESRGEVEAFLAGKGLAVPVFLDPDGSFSKQYAVATLPGLLILKNGQVAFRGKLPDDPDRVIAGTLG